MASPRLPRTGQRHLNRRLPAWTSVKVEASSSCAATQGVFTLTGQGHLLLPAAVRHWCSLAAGERVLLSADPAANSFVVYPPMALDEMVAQSERAVLGGDPA